MSLASFDIREHLERLEPNPRESGKYFCPACGGHNLSINLATGAYNCWADDSNDHRALIRENLSPAQLAPTRPSPGNRCWDYQTVEGEVATRVNRVDRPDSDKRIWRSHEQKELLLAVTPLYWAEAIRQFSAEGGRVFLVEGELAADELRALGLNAITLLGGSTGYRKELYYDLLFQIRDALVLCPDMDKPGMKLMDAVAADFPDALWCYVQGPNHFYWGADRLPDSGGYDLADAIRNGATVDRIISWIHRRQNFELTGVALDADLEVSDLLDGLMKVYRQTSDPAIREIKVAQYLKSSGLRDLGWSVSRAIKHCTQQQYSTGVLDVVDSHELMAMPHVRRPWIIPGFLPQGRVILLIAQGGVGKTTLSYQLAKHIAMGEPWSEFPVVKGKVLIISTDEPTNDTKEKLSAIDYASVPRGGVQFIRFWRFSQIDMLEEKIRQIEPTLVIVDSLTSTTAGMDADRTSSSAGDCMYELRDLAEKYECTFLVLHHMNKQGESRDSSTYIDNVSEAWKLAGDTANKMQAIITYQKSRSGFMGQAILERRLDGYKWTFAGRVDSHCDWRVENRVGRWINENLRIDGVENWLTLDSIAARATGLTTSEISAALPVLRTTGRIACDTVIIGGRTVRRYAAWDASPVASEPSATITPFPVAAPAPEAPQAPEDEWEELLLIVRHAMASGTPPDDTALMLATYPWPAGGRTAFWQQLDPDMREWLSQANSQKRA